MIVMTREEMLGVIESHIHWLDHALKYPNGFFDNQRTLMRKDIIDRLKRATEIAESLPDDAKKGKP